MSGHDTESLDGKIRACDLPCLILVGGLGTRLRSVVPDLPKPMATVCGRPFLEYLIRWVRAAGYKQIILCAGYRAAQIRDYFGDGASWDVELAYSIEEQPLGTWGAIHQAAECFGHSAFLVLNGDSWLDVDLMQLARFHVLHNSIATLALVEVNESSRFGRVEIDNQSKVTRFSEKAGHGPGLINGGIYLFSREVFSLAPKSATSLEHDVCPKLIAHGLYGLPTKGYFVDVGIPEEYNRLRQCPDPWLQALKFPVEKGIC